jgi:4-diphosphocytidyl-2-C-methyl-D-erythritol kinase
VEGERPPRFAARRADRSGQADSIEAGLGGGSSDAVAALRGLGRLWRVDEARLRAIAPALGADVPYFLEGGTVLGLERGDILVPQPDHRSAWVVLALPDFGVSTAEAFWVVGC